MRDIIWSIVIGIVFLALGGIFLSGIGGIY